MINNSWFYSIIKISNVQDDMTTSGKGMCVCELEFRENVSTTIVSVALLLHLDNKVDSNKSPRPRANILLCFFFFSLHCCQTWSIHQPLLATEMTYNCKDKKKKKKTEKRM